jgi:hypothetical protein
MQLLQRITGNPHTSFAALVAFGAGVVGIIWPELNDKMDKIVALAVSYGLLLAGDSGAKPTT